MRRRAARLAAVLAAAGTACSGGDGGGAPDAAFDYDAGHVPPAVELGTGERAFEPITDGQELQFIRGVQGGYHFLGSVRARGIDPGNPDDRRDPGNPTTTMRAFRDGERLDVGASIYTQGLEPADGEPGTFEMIGRLVIVDIDTCDELDGATVDLDVTVTDSSGETATDHRTVVAVPHPINSMTGGG